MYVVTGATGHIGSALIRELLAQGEKVTALVLPNEDISPLEGLDIDIARGDVRDLDSLIDAFKGAQYVCHLAGIVSISNNQRKLLYDVNVGGTKNVLVACQAARVNRLVYVSSIHAFIEPPEGVPITETKRFNPLAVRGLYAKSKAAATMAVLDAVKKGRVDAVIVHPTGVIGPYEFKMSHMGQMFMDFINKKLYAYIGGGYDFVDVRDVARGIVLACKKGECGENYILSGEQITVKHLLEMLEETTGIKAPRTKLPRWIALAAAPFSKIYYRLKRQQPLFTTYSIQTLTSNSLTSYSKAAKRLGYRPMPIKQSVIDTVNWLKKNKKGRRV